MSTCAERCEFATIYAAIQRALDEALGSEFGDGTGEGIVADVALVAQRYVDLRAEVIAHMGAGRGLQLVNQIEETALRT